jgi:hypothetical protein
MQPLYVALLLLPQPLPAVGQPPGLLMILLAAIHLLSYLPSALTEWDG